MLSSYAWLVPLLPWLAAGWIGLGWLLGWNRTEAGERETAWVALGAAGLSWLLTLGLGVEALIHGPPGQVRVGQWLASGAYQVPISFTLDPLGLSLAPLAAAIGALVLRFSVNYLHREAGFQRFFLVVSLFLGAMQWILLGGNLVLVFLGWELAGVCSFLLIAYVHQRPSAAANATRVLITNRIGDAAFLLGIFFAWRWLGIEWPELSQLGRLSPLQADLLALTLGLAALVKSAQVPFAPWISRALEGPTPSSALFYGSLLVHGGVILLIRLAPVLDQAPVVAGLLVLIGILTAGYGWLTGLVQADVKGALMAATSAQVGLMLVWIGLGWPALAAWHLGLHAAWRAYQFLQAPAFLDLAPRPARPVPGWLARRRWLHGAALHRFWLDPLADWLLVRPTLGLARDVQRFDERVAGRLVGMPAQAGALAADWEEPAAARPGPGVLVRVLERIADLLHWVEERLILRGGGEGLVTAIRRAGHYANRVEGLLSQPRYLVVLIVLTLVVIL